MRRATAVVQWRAMRTLALAMLMLPAWCPGASDEPHRAPEASAPVASAPPRAAVDPREATRRAAHDVLAEHCGECHEGPRPTAVAQALAVFDLDQPDWPSRFDDHRYQAALMRLAKKPAAARDAFIAFRDAELAGPPSKMN
jgi:hypothetical protein